MNDPHVVALLYRIEHAQAVDYSGAEPIHHEEEAFSVHVKDEQVRFELKRHYSSADDARDALHEYICAWQFSAGLQYGPNAFKLEFTRSEVS